ncbi:ANTAR domain-containing protein with unknown sensor [Amycolatopsis vancoresmycina DSM 44592]|uniref:ANTAR domain-containing protein n=1 Tax=Amycolatopsis vancoresmycina DSM 44592 TaxID=1292037 RepID=R1G0W7_9PSEU|nr:ANTAR domain-containing protein with unknown sensor [Amycolatopsis vancoresmycina DSM 44592]
MHTVDELDVEPVALRETLVLRAEGSLDAAATAGVVQSLHAAVAASPGGVVLDARDLDLLSARAARTLAAFVLGGGGRVRLVARPASAVARVLDLAGMAWFDDLEAAVAGRRPAGELEPAFAGFETLTRTLLGDTTVADALRHIVDAAVHVVAGADLVSITLLAADGSFFTPVETTPVANVLDQVQYRSGQGPCLSAALPSGPGYVISEDLRDDDRWPSFATAATGHGLRSIISTALQPADGGGVVGGALNLYSREPGGLDVADRHSALLLATHASLAIAHAQTAELAALERLNLRRAVSSRDVIGQAKGILMQRQGITAEAAFDLLRKTSQDLNVKLVDLAKTLADRRSEIDR